ncbi:hypothetical protein ACFO4E_22060 [Nocardiopsis mangrovi]|uniref:Uncharacterized protein n=1 Tax=Nocardiopsis mangrovi TaxID=1179818 RepID=A0ABV9E0D6_9ACTN
MAGGPPSFEPPPGPHGSGQPDPYGRNPAPGHGPVPPGPGAPGYGRPGYGPQPGAPLPPPQGGAFPGPPGGHPGFSGGPPGPPGGFPGPPGGPLPPGPGYPGYPGYPGGPPPRDPRRGWIVGGVAGGTAVALVIAGLLVWSLSGPGPAYTELAECDELLTGDLLAEIPGAEGADVEGDWITGEGEGSSEGADGSESDMWCSAFTDDSGEEPPVVNASFRLFPISTEEDDYAELQRQLDRLRRPIDRELDDGATSGDALTISDGFVADVEIRDLSVGEAGYAVDYSNVESDDFFEDRDGWAVAGFTTRNVMVSLVYEGTNGMRPAERLDAVSDAARLVEQSIGAVGRTA